MQGKNPLKNSRENLIDTYKVGHFYLNILVFKSEWFPDKELEVTIIIDTENTIHKLNLKIQHRTAELEAIQMFVKEQFYLF